MSKSCENNYREFLLFESLKYINEFHKKLDRNKYFLNYGITNTAKYVENSFRVVSGFFYVADTQGKCIIEGTETLHVAFSNERPEIDDPIHFHYQICQRLEKSIVI